MEDTEIYITEKDFYRLQEILGQNPEGAVEDLEIELERARIVPDNAVPKNLVTMNSKLTLKILQEDKLINIQLVYPQDADINAGKISVLSPLGAAVIGLRVGQKINWSFPEEKMKTVEIVELIYQPEASGDWHL